MTPQFEQFFRAFLIARGYPCPESISEIDMVDDVGLDSFETLTLIMELESRFEISLTAEDMLTLPSKTVSDWVKLIQSKA